MAKKLQVNQMTVCNWETKRTSPQLRFIPSIISLLGYDPYDTQHADLGKRIVAARRSMGLTQKELAISLDIDPSTLGRWERAERKPSEAHRKKLVAWLVVQRAHCENM